MLTDELFLDISRGSFNPGTLVPGDMYTDTSDMAGNLPILYALTRGLNASHVLEIGVNDGTSTLAFLKALSETEGWLTSIDVVDCPTAKALAKRFGYDQCWTFINGDSHDALVAALVRAEYDLVLVDGDHSHAGAMRDIELYGPMIRPGGFLLLHDCMMELDGEKPGCAVTANWLFSNDEWQGIMLPFSCQLGVFRRRAENRLRLKEMHDE